MTGERWTFTPLPAVDYGNALAWPVEVSDRLCGETFIVSLSLSDAGSVVGISGPAMMSPEFKAALIDLAAAEQRRCAHGVPSILGASRSKKCSLALAVTQPLMPVLPRARGRRRFPRHFQTDSSLVVQTPGDTRLAGGTAA